jgi:hypothetical protein
MKQMSKMSLEERVAFFVQCQQILITYHPDSVYLTDRKNLKERLSFARDFIQKYKGYCYADEKICVLFNKIRVDNPTDPVGALKLHLYQEPRTLDFNTYAIDFAVFRQLEDCLDFCKVHNSPQVKYVLFVHHNEVKLYDKAKLLSGVGALGI